MADVGEGKKKSRALILCFGATASEYDGDNTNVVKFYSLLEQDTLSEQLCYYQILYSTTFFCPDPRFRLIPRHPCNERLQIPDAVLSPGRQDMSIWSIESHSRAIAAYNQFLRSIYRTRPGTCHSEGRLAI
ncbi:hypothetical protein Hypma_016364 [Hypsizygus marmoreus]|uniref:Uncharacterized protein n=1 Tax=Hypsizygus marmoreus TaxID=39966 RepID=A0A369J597_HYPMA|nr:hypothetical protein Hypma_016364 [Hypsizygus marmoreus]